MSYIKTNVSNITILRLIRPNWLACPVRASHIRYNHHYHHCENLLFHITCRYYRFDSLVDQWRE